MQHSDFLKQYYYLQKDIMFTSLEQKPYGLLATSSEDNHPFWNNAYSETEIDAPTLQSIQSDLQNIGRQPSIYFELEGNDTKIKLLEQQGYLRQTTEAWMFYEHTYLDTSSFNNVKKVETIQELEKYLQTFNACYRIDDPNNPYGELGSYLKATENAWHRCAKDGKLEYYLVVIDNTPVAVSALTTHQKIGYISNVGSLTTVRGKGYGKTATFYAIYQSIKKGNRFHCLTTEIETNPNQFYKNLGMTTKFLTACYTKQ